MGNTIRRCVPPNLSSPHHHQFQFHPRISATSFFKYDKSLYFVKKSRKKCKNVLMGPVEEDVGPNGSRMGHPEGARIVVLSSNDMIYLIVLSFVFFFSQLSMSCRPYGALPHAMGEGSCPPCCATARGFKHPRVC